MPYVSVRASRNTRVGGGLGFWLVMLLFAWPFYALYLAIKGAVALTGWTLRSIDAHDARKKPGIEGARSVPAVRARASDPRHRQRVLAASLIIGTVILTLLTLAIASAARFR